MRLTVGSLPPAVYWRRRAFVLGAILLGLFLVAQACMAASASPDQRSAAAPPPTASTPASPPAHDPSPAPAAPSPSDEPGAGVPDGQAPDGGSPVDLGEDGCTDEEMLIQATAEPTSLSVGASARFSILIRNDSDRDCQRDVGADLRELLLRRGSGADRVWSSRDCNELRGRDVQELTPGIDKEHWLIWNGRASDSCEGTEPAGELLAPGEYELVARLGTAYSEPLTITLTEAS